LSEPSIYGNTVVTSGKQGQLIGVGDVIHLLLAETLLLEELNWRFGVFGSFNGLFEHFVASNTLKLLETSVHTIQYTKVLQAIRGWCLATTYIAFIIVILHMADGTAMIPDFTLKWPYLGIFGQKS